jgi:hypothetical protein
MTYSECRPTVRLLPLLVLLPALACSGGDGGGGAAVQGPPGDVRLGAVTLPTQGQAGHPVSLTAEVVSDTPKYNVTVRFSLVRTADPSSVDPLAPGFKPDVQVWGTVIDELVAGVPTVLVESFDLPPELAATTYAVVLELNAVDFTSEDDALQGEEAAHRANNARVGAAALVVTRPALADIDVTDVALDRDGFDLQDLHPPPSFGAEEELFGAEVTVVARTYSVRDPVAFGFELGIPTVDPAGVASIWSWYPLDVGAAGAGGEYAGPMVNYVLEPEAQLDAEEVSTFVALLANQPRSFQVGLHAPAVTHDALAAHGVAADCQVRAFLVPALLSADHSTANNERLLPIAFAPAGYDHAAEEGAGPPLLAGSGTLTPGAPAAHGVKTWHRGEKFAWKAAFAGKYYVDAVVSTNNPDAQRSRDLRLTTNATASLKLLGVTVNALSIRTVGNLDLDSATGSGFGASVDGFTVRILTVSEPFAAADPAILLYERTQELYSVTKKEQKKYLLAGFIPMTVTGIARLELGLSGTVTAGPDRRMTFAVGPYLNATGSADATVNLVVASGGVTGRVRFLSIDQKFRNAIVLADDLAKEYQFGERFDLKTLDGDVFLHAKTAAGCGFLALSPCYYRHGLFKWRGFEKVSSVPIANYRIASPP